MTPLFYGFIGAHRTGKTTLAAAVAEELGLPFFKTSVSKTLADHGVNPQADMPFAERLRVQEIVLDGLLANYAEAQEHFPDARIILVDRTPLDVLSYTMSEIQRTTMLIPGMSDAVSSHVRHCVALANFNLLGGCLVPPGIAIVPDATKATPDIHYQRHIHATMLDAVLRPDVFLDTFVLYSGDVDLSSRVSDTCTHLLSIMSDDSLTQTERQPTQSLH